MNHVSIEWFCAVCSDNAGNMKKACALLKELLPTALNLGDCCYHLHNTAKDISALSDFTSVRKIHASHTVSNIAVTSIAHLKPTQNYSVLSEVNHCC